MIKYIFLPCSCSLRRSLLLPLTINLQLHNSLSYIIPVLCTNWTVSEGYQLLHQHILTGSSPFFPSFLQFQKY
ncbi:hypothetical protein CW304_28045 [Bacillus sp. UFRGS-B20]|nr:hypothetical protein CW304_28045 [Bacillus sp. UFRGS-B20]